MHFLGKMRLGESANNIYTGPFYKPFLSHSERIAARIYGYRYIQVSLSLSLEREIIISPRGIPVHDGTQNHLRTPHGSLWIVNRAFTVQIVNNPFAVNN